MKYMGSKLSMLQNGLGTLIRSRARSAERVVDLFSGSAAVSWFVAENTQTRVLSNDLQEFASVLARAVIGRTAPLDPAQLGTQWFVGANAQLWGSRVWYKANLRAQQGPDKRARGDFSKVLRGPVRRGSDLGSLWGALLQSFAGARDRCPAWESSRIGAGKVCLFGRRNYRSSKCAAAPGHTAQPLSPMRHLDKNLYVTHGSTTLHQWRCAFYMNFAPASPRLLARLLPKMR